MSEKLRTICIPDDWSMPYFKDTGEWLNPSEVEDLVEAGSVLNADGSTMTLEQYKVLAYGNHDE